MKNTLPRTHTRNGAMRIATALILSTAAALFLSVPAEAAVLIASHQGKTDPKNEGWTLGTLNPQNSVGPVDDENAWQTKDVATDGSNGDVLYQYNFDSLGAEIVDGWRLTATLKVVSASSHTGALLSITDASLSTESTRRGRRFMLTFDNGGVGGNTRVGLWNTGTSMVDIGTKDYFTIHLVNDGESTLVYLGNSVTPFLNANEGQAQNANVNQLHFGTASRTHTATINWKDITLHGAPSPIPEGKTALMLLPGLGLLALYSRRRHRSAS